MAPYADRLLARSVTASREDPTQQYRDRLQLESFVGRSPAIAALLREVALVAPLDIDVLLTGGSGTGKSQIARVIHDNSQRASQAFVDLNCAAIPDSLIESELFGAVQGAHSTALRRIDGKLTAAQGGTLLLDEVGELSPSAQAKLLQLLQSPRPIGVHSTASIRAPRTLWRASKRSSPRAEPVMTVSPALRTSAMMPREMTSRTASISAAEKPCARHQRGASDEPTRASISRYPWCAPTTRVTSSSACSRNGSGSSCKPRFRSRR